MQKYITTGIGRLRLLAFLEGLSLVVLVFIAMPLKYLYHDPSMVRSVGMAHGILFLLFVFSTISVAMEQKWKFTETTWQVLAASFIPFGTFYIDYKILRNIPATES